MTGLNLHVSRSLFLCPHPTSATCFHFQDTGFGSLLACPISMDRSGMKPRISTALGCVSSSRCMSHRNAVAETVRINMTKEEQ